MRINVNGVHLYFDVEGAGLQPRRASMEQKPTLILLHGGPGADHSLYKPSFSVLADVAQVIYLDHRGNGRSDSGPVEDWTLAQWADDLVAFCGALDIRKPIVYGASFGGMVAMAYATRHPGHPGKLILVSTTAQASAHADAKVAMFARLGGAEAGELAHRRFIQGDTSPEVLSAWVRVALPLYTQRPQDPDSWPRQVLNQRVREWFYRSEGEGRDFDMLADLALTECETLVLGGVLDPMVPIECQRDIVSAMRPERVRYREFQACGHGVVPDCPDEAMMLLRQFITGTDVESTTPISNLRDS